MTSTRANSNFDLTQIPASCIHRFKKIKHPDQKEYIYAQYQERKKSLNMAYVISIFGGHYFYIGRIVPFIFALAIIGGGVGFAILKGNPIGGIGFIWVLIDWFRMKDLINRANEEIFDQLLKSSGY